MVLSDFVRAWVRDRMGVENKKEYREKKPRKKYREKNTEEYREIAAQIAKVGNNVNQLARWANTFKQEADAVRVVRVLGVVVDKMETIIAMVRGE